MAMGLRIVNVLLHMLHLAVIAFLVCG